MRPGQEHWLAQGSSQGVQAFMKEEGMLWSCHVGVRF